MRKQSNEIRKMEVTIILAVGANFRTWMRLIIENKFNLSLRKIPQIFFITFIVFFFAPLCIFETLLFNRKIKNIKLEKDPLFILGHWRNGTTYLHELLIRNPNHAYMTVFESIFSNHFLYFEKLIKWIFGLFLPETRPQDDVKIGVDTPHEHDFAIANLCSMSVYSGAYFPLNQEFYNRYVSYEGLSQNQIDQVKYYTDYVIKKLYLKKGDKLLILKSPIDTAKVDLLLDLYPNAKFVHIYRNPYKVFFSTKKMHEKTIPIYRLQEGYPDLDKFILTSYRDIYEKYYTDKKLIPKQNLIEIKYEDFIAKPITFIKQIYDKFNLEGFEESLQDIEEYLNRERDYKRDKYEISIEDKKRIYSHWNKIIDRMGYEKPKLV